MRIGGGQDEFNMGRWFLERLQQGIEGLQCEHMRFIDDVDLTSALRWREMYLVSYISNLVDAPVTGSI